MRQKNKHKLQTRLELKTHTMEEQLIDSSKYKLYLHSLDSRFADASEYNNSSFKMVLPYPLKNIMRVRLASIELPLVEYLFSEQYGNITMAVGVGTANFRAMKPLVAGNYTSSELSSTIDANLKLLHSGFSCTITGANGQCTIRNTAVPFELYTFSFDEKIAKRKTYWGLGYYLGFRQGRISSKVNADGSHSVTGTSVVNIQQNQYYILQLFYPDPIVNVTHRLGQKDFLEAFAKVVLKDGYFTISFDDNSNLMRKEYTFLAPVTISEFKIKLLNPYGEPVNMLHVDWSVTLEITEVVNSKTYMKLSNTYNQK
jgi:NADPH-dependent 7-cyano-7-deazaguanine reductase QueF-like protein